MKLKTLAHYNDELQRKIHFVLGKRNILVALWWGVKIKKSCTFTGKTYFKRYPQSKIAIGDFCQFRSKINSNLIGINRPCSISTLTQFATIEIGKNSGFSGTVIAAFKSIKIGDNVKCGANTLITDSDWHADDPRSGNDKEVIIGNNVWLGVNSVVLKGVKIGNNTLIGANSVVTKDIPANVIAAGNPCKVVKQLDK